LIGELHRRSVWQVLGSYAVVAWVILQLAETLEGLIGLPLWFGPGIVVLTVLGFPILLITTLTQGGWRGGRGAGEAYEDSAAGGDPSLHSWRRLDPHPVRVFFRTLFTWRNALMGGVVALLVFVLGSAGYSGLRSAGIGPLGSLVARGVFETNENLILADFEDNTPEGNLGETVTTLFRIDLTQSPTLHLLDRSELSAPLARMQRNSVEPVTEEVALDLAQRAGVKAVVAGEVLPLGQGAVVSARLVVAGSGETLAAFRETARTVDEVPEAVDRLSAKLRERIGESLRSIQADPPLEEVTTTSLEALRRYAQADWALGMGDVTAAETLVKEAISLDTTFSMAYRKLGVILSNNDRNAPEAREAFTKAYQGREKLPERERLLAEAAYYTYVTEQVASAVHAYEQVLALHPTDGIAENNLAVLYGEEHREDKAAHLYVQAIERGHAPAITYANAAFTLFSIGQADSAAAIVQRFQEAYPKHPQAIQYAAAVASAGFDYGRAEALVRALLAAQAGNARWEMWGEAELAYYAMAQGRLNEGMEHILRAYDRQKSAGTRFTELARPALWGTGMAEVQLYLLEDPRGAVQTLDAAVGELQGTAVEPEARGRLDFATLYAGAGRPDRARAMLAAFQAEVSDSVRKEDTERGALLFAEGATLLSEGDASGALSRYRQARLLVPDCPLCGLLEMGEAYEAASMPDSAALKYQEYLDSPVLFRAQTDGSKLHRALLGLARCDETLGRTDRASEVYQRQAALWENADPGLQPRVRVLGDKIVALRGDRQ